MIKHDQKKHQDKKLQNVTSYVFSEIMIDEFGVWDYEVGMVTARPIMVKFKYFALPDQQR